MKLKTRLFLYAGFMGAAILLLVWFFKTDFTSTMDTAAVNDIRKSVADKWDRLSGETLPGMEYGLDYVVLDQDGVLLAATRKGLSENVYAAVSNQDTIVDVEKNGQILGKLLIYNTTSEQWQQYHMRLRNVLLGILFGFMVTGMFYFIYLDRMIFRPFRKLQMFAGHVAQGNLDIPLSIDKNNTFGAFTESFDLMRDELKTARENERLANQSKKELVASLSHDIKTPVASIQAVAEVMEIKTRDNVQKEQLAVIREKAEQINSLVSNMFQATLEELQQLHVKVKEHSSETLEGLILKSDYKKYARTEKIPECMICMDPLRMEQVIDNIIGNAYKYAGTEIQISARIVGRELEMCFQDYGNGVEEREIPLLFQKFYRGSGVEKMNGTGLGLYISSYLMEAMDGRIEAENVEEGFQILVYLKLAS